MLVTPGSVRRPFNAKPGEGMPQRIRVSTRSPAAIATTGALWSGKMPGMGGRLPAASRIARATSRIASCPLVRE
jgi:hypothetical protein